MLLDSASVPPLGAKKPLRLRCPEAVADKFDVADPDFGRFEVLGFDDSATDRFLPAVNGELEGMEGVEAETLCFSPVCSVDVSGFERPVVAGCMSEFLSSSTVPFILCDCCIDGLRANISRMFLRPTNSGMSLPDIGSRSLTAEYSLWRIPLVNMPAGFITSRTSRSSPLMEILSLINAYTGQ